MAMAAKHRRHFCGITNFLVLISGILLLYLATSSLEHMLSALLSPLARLGLYRSSSMSGTLDLLRLTASDIQSSLSTGKVSSVELVEAYLEQISSHDGYLHAMIDVAPKKQLLQRAEEMDAERIKGFLRSKLHGVPILIKASSTSHHSHLIQLMFSSSRITWRLVRGLECGLLLAIMRWLNPSHFPTLRSWIAYA